MSENLPIHAFKADENEEVLLIHDTENRTFWASQKQMAAMFGVSQPTINEHIRAIEKELGNTLGFKRFPTVVANGKMYQVKHYNQEIFEMVKSRIRRSGKPIQHEKEVFHALVENLLTAEGFLFIRHEVPMSVQGKADFMAYHPGQMSEYVIECKVEPFKTRHCSQVWDYAQQVKWDNEQNKDFDEQVMDVMPQMALAYPAEHADSINWEYCERLNIWIILVAPNTYLDFSPNHPAHDVLLNQLPLTPGYVSLPEFGDE